MPTKAAKKNKGAAVAPAKAKMPKVKEPESDSEDSSEGSSEEEAAPVKAPAKTKAGPPKKQPADDSEDDSDDSDEEDSDDEKPAFPTPKANPKGSKAAQKKPAPTAEESSEESSDEDDAPKPAKNAAAAEEDSGDDSESEEDDSDESDGSEEEAPPPKVVKGKQTVPAKTKAPAKMPGNPTVVVSNAKGVEEEALKKVFKKKGIKVKEIKRTDKKTLTVGLAEAGDVSKAVALSGEDVGGRSIKIEPAAPVSAQKKEAKKAVKRPADDDDEEDEEEDDDDEEDEEEQSGKRKKSDDAGASKKKHKLDEGASEGPITLFVGNLNNETTDEDLQKFFKKKGVKVKEVRKAERKRFGYVDLNGEDDLEGALALDGESFEGNEIKVERARPKDQSFEKAPRQDRGGQQTRPERDTSADARTLFVKGLAESVTESALKEFFSQAEEVRLPQRDGYHKGFAYVVFADVETANSVMSEKQGAELEGSALYLDHTGTKSSFKPRDRDSFGRDGGSNRSYGGDDRRKSSGERGSSNVLFVKNLSFNLDEDSLKDAFPNATSARIARFQDTDKPRGFGFVEFGSPEDAAKAYDKLKNTEIDGRQVFLDFASPGGGRGGGRGGRGGFGDRGGRGGFRGRGGRGGFGDRGGRGGRGGGYGGRGGFGGRGGGGRSSFGESQGKKKRFDSDSE